MTPQEIIDAYDVLAQDIRNNAATEAARVGNAQRSLGPLAARVASPSGQTSGLANYTYNRVMRPSIDTNAAALITQGKAQAMNTYLNNELLKAKAAYEDAKNKYQVAATSPTSKNGGGNGVTEGNLVDFSGRLQTNDGSSDDVLYPANKMILAVGTTGNGSYRVIIADGKGGSNTTTFMASSREDAIQKAIKGGYAFGVWDSAGEMQQ